MSMPSPFELGRAVGGNISRGFREAGDVSAIDKILQDASTSEDPDALTMAMQGILRNVSPERQPQAIALLQNKASQIASQNKSAATRAALQSQGFDPAIADLDPALQKEIVKGKFGGKANDKARQAEGALELVNRQRELLKSGHLGSKVAFRGTGRKAGSTFSPEGIKKRAEYERNGKALISFASPIVIRNRSEFETLAADLYDTNKTNEEIEGILDSMERIIRLNLPSNTANANVPANSNSSTAERPPLTSFVR